MKNPINHSLSKLRRLSAPGKSLVCALASGILSIPALAGTVESPASTEVSTSTGMSSSIQKLWKETTSAIQFGGFASQGYLINTGDNNYFGDTSDGTFDFREYGINASYAIGKFRFGAQAFGQKLGVYGDDKMTIDWATGEYQPFQWLGLRAGRVKQPRGLYNEALDLDSTRPFVLLPQSVYDARLRSFNASFDGGMLFGNINLGKVGSLDYKAFVGDIPISIESGASDFFNNDSPATNRKINMESVAGGTLFWNTPISGLRVGYSFSRFNSLISTRDILVAGLPLPITYQKTAKEYDRHLVSLEYTKGDWVFAAEAGTDKSSFSLIVPEFPDVLIEEDFDSKYFYVSVARRMNKWLELGMYYSYSQDEQPVTYTNTPLVVPDRHQGDLAISAKFDLSDHIVFKVEGHYMDGAGKVFDTVSARQPLETLDNSWFLFAAKLTYSF